MSTKAKAIRLPIEVIKRPNYSGRRGTHVHDAQVGRVGASAPTASEAIERLTETVATMLAEDAEPVMLPGFDGSIWIAYRTQHGAWVYAIRRPCQYGTAADRGLRHGFSGTMIHGRGDRDATIEAMHAHWYQANIEPIVLGIVGLCTDQRQWVCKRCQSASRGSAPYVCQNPACGYQVIPPTDVTKDWIVRFAKLTGDRAYPLRVEGHNAEVGEAFSWRVPWPSGYNLQHRYDFTGAQMDDATREALIAIGAKVGP